MSIQASKAFEACEDSLPDVLMRIVSELHDVAYLIERIEPMLAHAHEEAILAAADRMKVLQGIDLAVQKTRGIAEFIDTMTAGIPKSQLVDITTALNLMTLADMKAALSRGQVRHGHSQPLTNAAGDMEFF
ncbi:hypothetical protein BJF92_16825 [Rhizobium rhizosphaerae]|uniref:Uncharacterized protein n=1 Tax=Xaviernesmea rhizosphaerae TaxID=1672749 RepID=A0A1Q9AII1_9HYPH|nr:hypothetical protein [Xaviernesmea rhizosphaerae]OLP55061.1 hypothetical protein BJF92_16825 [Xaviernesmea rhizosphaerae]OQP85769.1 hypothetical protein BTR14_13360 [Xaviernesmea rhizosphaerae]